MAFSLFAFANTSVLAAMTVASLSGSYKAISKDKIFEDFGTGVLDFINTHNITLTFNGNGGCTFDASGEEYEVVMGDPDTVDSGIYEETGNCTYSVSSDGETRINFSDGSGTFWLSASGNVLLGGDASIDDGWYQTGTMVAVKIDKAASSPTTITVPQSDPDGGYAVSWSVSLTPGTSYVLEEATNPSFSGSQKIYEGKGTTVNLKGRSAGKTYYYRVKAFASGYTESDWVEGSNGCDVPYVVSTKVGSGGTVTADGPLTVQPWEVRTFTIEPLPGYHVVSVLVDRISKGSATSVSVPEDLLQTAKKHTISAKFAINSYSVTATAGVGGTIKPAGTKIFKHGKTAKFTITPSAGKTIASVLVNGEPLTGLPDSGSYKMFLPITEATMIEVAFE